MIKKTIRVSAFLILLLLMFYGTFQVIRWKDTAGDYVSSVKMLYNTEDDLIDVVFVGSSHCYLGMNPAVVWDEYGMAAFDMAISGMDKDSAYHALKELLKTQKPKVVYVDLYPLTFDRHLVVSNVYRNMLGLNLSKNSYELVRKYQPDDGWENYVLRWPILHTRYRELKREDFVVSDINQFGRGQNMGFVVKPGARPTTCDTDETIQLSEKNQQWLVDFYELSKEYDFQLGFIVIPFYFQDDEQKIINSVKAFAEERNIDFLDMNRIDIGLDYNADFVDVDHCNYFGSKKVTKYVGEYLKEHYDLADHRGDPRYYQWVLDSNYNNHRLYQYELSNASIADGSYNEKLTEGKDQLIVYSLNGEYDSGEDRIYPILAGFGVTLEDYRQGGKWVFNDGELLARFPAGSTEEFYYEINEKDTLRIQAGNEDIFDDIKFNTNKYVTIYNGLGIYVYDKVLKDVISVLGVN